MSADLRALGVLVAGLLIGFFSFAVLAAALGPFPPVVVVAGSLVTAVIGGWVAATVFDISL